ncbi:hypothetical protein [Lederbergia lenta]|uniref:DUF4352 domain-containing protein n=1 Tax=Lederbergia lenta TaxID=1467 RepID=A0A2X4W596_LEDLE|nr:hypothetical protein [Lederbergia lenta]MCM3109790.1 hypothetical protein [Lederbergia lenta]MEC2324460.1 hypothetical protein [Lederbergia lenta]SQI59817.1 Uncharacterised protein [Lederbergia lenta]
MKKPLIILLSLFLVACGLIIAETPEEALEKFDSKENTFKITKVLNTASYNEKQGFYVFEAEVENKTKWFVANIVNNDLYWYVKDSIDIGAPNSENEAYSAETDTFTAGISNKAEEKKDNRIIVDIPQNDHYVWIERFKNKK